MHSYALRVHGDSMTAPYGRSYPDSSIIYVDPDQRGGVVSGDRVIAKINGDNQVTFKVFVEDAGRRFLKPLNPSYPVITDPFRILGKVIGTWIPE
jgi:SOS-response transcriptional repressor LexA